MLRLGSVLGFVLGLAVLFAAYMGAQESSVAETKTAGLGEGCVAEKVPLDEGYGVSRVETRIVCPQASNDAERPVQKD